MLVCCTKSWGRGPLDFYVVGLKLERLGTSDLYHIVEALENMQISKSVLVYFFLDNSVVFKIASKNKKYTLTNRDHFQILGKSKRFKMSSANL